MKKLILPILILLTGCASITPLPGSNSVLMVKEGKYIENCELKGQIESKESMKWSQSAESAIFTDLRNQAHRLGANRVYMNTGFITTALAYYCS